MRHWTGSNENIVNSDKYDLYADYEGCVPDEDDAADYVKCPQGVVLA